MRLRTMVLSALVGVFVLASGGVTLAIEDMPGMGAGGNGGLIGPAVDELGDTEHGECVEELLDLPALNACEDAEGRVIMDLPALTLIGPAADKPDEPSTLPTTGVNVGDIAALGLVALGAGGVLLRRMRFATAA